MASKSSQPALYEKMRSGAGGVAVPSPRVERHAPIRSKDLPPTIGTVTEASRSIGPGRVVRMPAGFLMLACGAIILFLAMSYMVGHKRGYGTAKVEYEKLITAATVPVNDPLSNSQTVVDVQRASNNGSGKPNPESGSAAGTSPRNDPSAWKTVIPAKDPRKKGLNYFILAQTTEQGAKLLADFCRTNGLETYVVTGNNDRSRRVVAFPGFEASARTSPDIKALEAEKWKKIKASAGDDLHSAYASLYGG
jgi:hypothetical protein